MTKKDFLKIVKENKSAFEEVQRKYEEKDFKNIRIILDQDDNEEPTKYDTVIDLFVDTDPGFELGQTCFISS